MKGVPAYSARLVTQTAEGQQLDIAVAAGTPTELAEMLGRAAEIAERKRLWNNAQVLDMAQLVGEQQRQIFAEAVARAEQAVLAELRTRGVIPWPNGGVADGDSAGTVHAPADS